MLESSVRYLKREGIDCSQAPDGYVIYLEASAKVIFLNPTAAVILELCDGESDAGQIATHVRELFGLSHDPAPDVAACLISLASEGLVQVCENSLSAD